MSKVSADTPSKAQQSCVGTDSTKPCGTGLATAAGGAVRIIGAEGTLAGCTPSFTVAFIGESAIRAVSLRGPAGATPRPASGLAGGKTGFGGAGAAGGFRPDGGGGGTKAFAGAGGGGVGEVAPGGGGTGAFASGGAAGGLAAGGGGGRLLFDPGAGGGTLGLMPDDGGGAGGLKPGAGGRLLGGRTAPEGAEGAGGGVGGRAGGVPAAGGSGFGATAGGGRTAPEDGGRKFAPGGLAPGGAGARVGKLIRAVSFSTGTVGRFVVRGGSVMRTVSFFGSFRSAITNFNSTPRERRQRVSQTPSEVSTINHPTRPNRNRERPEFFA